jgi:hypothetical protein
MMWSNTLLTISFSDILNSIVYYPQGNGKVKSTNKVFRTLLTKLVNENRND